MEFMILFWLGGAIIVGIIADSKGRFGIGYFVASLFVTPLLTGILVLALPNLKVLKAAAANGTPTPETHVKCPDCRELVMRDARKCKHCGTGLIPQ